MEVIIGLGIIALGSLGQSSSYVPINKVRKWSWENFWLMQGVFAWLIFPLIGTLSALPDGYDLLSLFRDKGTPEAIFYGVLWGIGGLTFGLSMRYLGVALGQSIALGTCAAFGTLLPALFGGADLLHGAGLSLLLGVMVTLLGISVIGYAGMLRAKSMSEEEQRRAVKDFALTKGLLVALTAGLMSACFALGLNAAESIKEGLITKGVDKLYAGLPSILLVTIGGFLTNATYCLYQNVKHKTFHEYREVSGKALLNNILFCALAGLLWYSQFFGLEIGKSFLGASPLLMAFSWSILMALNVTFSNIWGIVLHEWKGCGAKTKSVLVIGILILVFSVFFPVLF